MLNSARLKDRLSHLLHLNVRCFFCLIKLTVLDTNTCFFDVFGDELEVLGSALPVILAFNTASGTSSSSLVSVAFCTSYAMLSVLEESGVWVLFVSTFHAGFTTGCVIFGWTVGLFLASILALEGPDKISGTCFFGFFNVS